jgi:DNA-binding SARP family transcriptional activator/tetratricopeptide (TPR) repeat protein/DNA-binding XRE family transcriptional regulator
MVPPTLGDLVRAHRARRGMTQLEVAAGAGLSVRAVRDIENNRVRRPHRSSVPRLAAALGLSEADRAALLTALAPAAAPGRARLSIEVLGPLSVCRDGRPVEFVPGMLRDLLGLLALHPRQPVSGAEIVDVLWGERPPKTCQHLLQVYIGRLRALTEPARRSRSPATVVGRSLGGYRLDVAADDLDLARFDDLVTRAEHADGGGDREAALELLGQALDCWRGPVLADAGARLRQHPTAVAVSRRRVAAALAYADLALDRGRYDQVTSSLRAVAADEPLHEGLAARLMVALAGGGEQAAALALFEGIRGRLDADLGVTPGAELSAAHLRVLRHQLPARSLTAGPTPAQLPADVAAFTGRGTELADLDQLLRTLSGAPADGARASTAVVISAVSGTAGVGKTALAVRWSHRVAGRFPGGQLYVNLRGYDPAQPVSPTDALAGFLTALGVPGQDIPVELADRAARYRTEAAGRSMLIVLDNAGSAEQVRPLLPGAPGCLVLVTSRDALPGLVSRDGARRIDLDLLPRPDAVALLRQLIGSRVDAEPAAAATLAEQCARLPLALRIAAERAAAHPASPLSRLVDELTDQQRRLDLLDAGGDPRTAVRAVFSWSYHHLPAGAARAFRLLGLHPAADLDAYAAAALTRTTVKDAEGLLDTLTRAHLLQSTGPPRGGTGLAGSGRHGMHDLLRAYSAGLAGSHDTPDQRHDALTRLFDYYLGTAATAMDIWWPTERQRRPRVDPPATPTPTLTDPDAARAWLDIELPTLTAVCAHTAGHGWPAHTIALAATLYRYLDIAGPYPAALTIHTHAARAAEQAADLAGQATALTGIGGVHWRLGRSEQAAEVYLRATTLFRQVGDRLGEARAVANLGGVSVQLGRYEEAADQHQQSLALFRQLGDAYGEGGALTNLGLAYERLGRYEQAADHHRQAATVFRRAGIQVGEGHALTCLGLLDQRLGHCEQAADHHRQALARYRQVDYQAGEAAVLTNLGAALTGLGDHEQAAEHHRQGLGLFRDLGDRYGEAVALNGLGEALHAAGQPEHASSQHTAALAISTDTRDRDEQARAHNGLARSHHTRGRTEQARAHWEHALTLYTTLGMPDAADIRARLATLDHTSDSDT